MTSTRKGHRGGNRLWSLIAIGAIAALLSACGTREPYSALRNALRVGGNGASAGALGAQSPSGTDGTGGTAGSAAGGSVASNGSSTGADGTGASAGTAGAAGAVTRASGSSGSPLTATPNTGSGVPGVDHCGAELSPVIIGSVGTQSGIVGAAVAAGAKAVSAWAAYVNSLGGLRCHPIKYVVADDGGNPSTNASETQQLVEQDHVAAFVYNDAPESASGSESYLVQNQIPIIGNEGAEQFMYQYPFFFPQAPNGSVLTYATFASLKPMMTSVQMQGVAVISCVESSECTTAKNDAPADTAKLGMKLVYNGSASITQPSFSANCLQATQAGAKMILLVLDPNSIERAGSNCRQSGFTGLLATGAVVVVGSQASDPDLDGMVFGTVVAPWTLTSNPQVQLMTQVMNRFEPGVGTVGSVNLGWASAQLFAESSLYWPNKDTITSKDIIAAMDQVKGFDDNGFNQPLTFTAGQNAPQTACWWGMEIKGGTFVTANPNRQCMS